MDYAAALRAAPSGPAVKLNTAPVNKQVAKPAPRPVKVVEAESAPVVEEEAVPSVAVAAAPVQAPANAGLSPVVRFVINVPHSGSNANHKDATPAENNAEDAESSDNADEETTGDASANGAKSHPAKEAKSHNFSAQDLENVRFTFLLIPPIFSSRFEAYPTSWKRENARTRCERRMVLFSSPPTPFNAFILSWLFYGCILGSLLYQHLGVLPPPIIDASAAKDKKDFDHFVGPFLFL